MDVYTTLCKEKRVGMDRGTGDRMTVRGKCLSPRTSYTVHNNKISNRFVCILCITRYIDFHWMGMENNIPTTRMRKPASQTPPSTHHASMQMGQLLLLLL